MGISARPAGRLWWVIVCGLALVVTSASAGRAHPVSQGALEIDVSEHSVRVTARVSMEEVLVAAAYVGGNAPSALEALRQHGPYLLAHLKVATEGRRLDGFVASLPDRVTAQPVYRLEYPTAGGVPARVTLEEDVLRELEFAPGTPWEATYVVRVSRDGRPALDGLLLTHRAPLVLHVGALPRGGLARLDALRLAGEYARHGVVHILSGYDHLLFIVALVLAVVTVWDLVAVVTAFTLAHSITLTLSVLNVVRLPSSIVEPMIAASIVFVALQNIVLPAESRGPGRLAVAFFFGLFHGLGFAGGLLAAMEGLGGWAVGLAIVAFSVGVEAGHQMVVLPILGVLGGLRRHVPESRRMPARVLRYGSVGIFVAGVWYLVAALR